jgi:type IV pilus assembly protein PilY1
MENRSESRVTSTIRAATPGAAPALGALVLTLLFGVRSAGALDLDIFSGTSVDPNVLILFDNSGSMGNVPYNTFPNGGYTGAFEPGTIYTRCRDKNGVSGGNVRSDCSCRRTQSTYVIDESTCAASFIDLLPSPGDDIDDREGRRKKGNRLNWEQNQPRFCTEAPFEPCATQADCEGVTNGCQPQNQLGLAKSAMISTINDPQNEGVRWGVMLFNPPGINYITANYASESWVSAWHDSAEVFQFGVQDIDTAGHAQLVSTIGGFQAGGGTPTAVRLIDAWKYFNGESSIPGYTTSPVEQTCQRNYFVMVTDGVPEMEASALAATQNSCSFDRIESFLGSPGDYNADGKEDPSSPNWTAATGETFNCGSDYLDDVMIKIRGSFPMDNPENQPVKLYGVSFGINYCEPPAAGDTSPGAGSLLWRASKKYGGGECISALTPNELDDALREILNLIRNDAQSFVAPVVPVSQTNRTQSGDRLYVALFAPNENGQGWPGNIKKYALNLDSGVICDASSPSCSIGNGSATTADGTILGTAESFWDAASGGPSGSTVTSGGVGGVLQQSDVSQRRIFTYLGTATGNLGGLDLTSAEHEFSRENTAITNETLGLSGALGQPADRDALIDYLYGFDAYDADNDGDVSEKRGWVLGDIIHSVPLLVDYPSQAPMIVVGANDGMLHAFDDDTGEELWAFVPPDVLENLFQLVPGQSGTHPFFVDGSPRLRTLSDGRKIVVFGLRRGGRAYYGLDITDRFAPKLLWRINETTPGFSELGQSWSTPAMKKFFLGTQAVDVAIFGGGYDPSFDDPSQTTPNSASGMGRALFMVDLLTGAPFSISTPAEMNYPVTGEPLLFDVNGDGVFDRGYIGDLGGNLWRIGFDLQVDRLFRTPGGLRIFERPDAVVNRGSVTVYFGTGDRVNPMRTDVVNRFYAVRDDGTNHLVENDLVDVTNRVTSAGSTESIQLAEDIASAQGWYLRLSASGEKVLAAPSVYFNLVFTTFTPSTEPCAAGGEARIYALDPLTGNPTTDLAGTSGDGLGGGGTGTGGTGTLSASDRFVLVGNSIPTEIKVTFGEDQTKAFFGVTKGGGIALQPLNLPQIVNNVVPTAWREVW